MGTETLLAQELSLEALPWEMYLIWQKPGMEASGCPWNSPSCPQEPPPGLQTHSSARRWPRREGEQETAAPRPPTPDTILLGEERAGKHWLQSPERGDMILGSSGKSGALAPVARPTDPSTSPVETPAYGWGLWRAPQENGSAEVASGTQGSTHPHSRHPGRHAW